MGVDPHAETEISDPAVGRTVVSLPPIAVTVALPDAAPEVSPRRRMQLWWLAAALVAGIATAFGVAYALHQG